MDEIRILLVEDSPADARLIEELLSEGKRERVRLEWARRLDEARRKATSGGVDLVLLDLSLPDSRGIGTYELMREANSHLPVIVLTGLDDEELALRAVRQGAQDYLVKDQVNAGLLERAIRYAIERQQIQRELHNLNADLEQRVAERTQQLSVAYEQLAQANGELRELDRLKSAFIAVTSHELRTPLMVINGTLSVIRAKLGDSRPDLMRMLEASVRASKKLERIIVGTHKINQKGEYRERFLRKPAHMADLVQQVVNEVMPFVELRQQRLSVGVARDLPLVKVDPDKIRDVLVNLLMNAIKFTPNGGALEVCARMSRPDQMEICVSDNGVGITEEDKPNIFDEFFSTFRVQHHSSGEYEFEKRGIGLGLALVKNFVHMHGGDISVESAPGKGSAFYFTLPVQAESEPFLAQEEAS